MEVLSSDPHTSPPSHLCMQLYPSCSNAHSHLTISSIQHPRIPQCHLTIYCNYPSDSHLTPCNTPLCLNIRVLKSRYTFTYRTPSWHHEGPHVTLHDLLSRLTGYTSHFHLTTRTVQFTCELVSNITFSTMLYYSHPPTTGIFLYSRCSSFVYFHRHAISIYKIFSNVITDLCQKPHCCVALFLSLLGLDIPCLKQISQGCTRVGLASHLHSQTAGDAARHISQAYFLRLLLSSRLLVKMTSRYSITLSWSSNQWRISCYCCCWR